MRIGGEQEPEEPEQEIPLEVQLFLNRGWALMKTERRGIVLTGPKEMRGRTKFMIVLGVILAGAGIFKLGSVVIVLGAGLLILSAADYQYATRPPTKFFPAEGEKKRTMERG
jgi:hypothetical protein